MKFLLPRLLTTHSWIFRGLFSIVFHCRTVNNYTKPLCRQIVNVCHELTLKEIRVFNESRTIQPFSIFTNSAYSTRKIGMQMGGRVKLTLSQWYTDTNKLFDLHFIAEEFWKAACKVSKYIHEVCGKIWSKRR